MLLALARYADDQGYSASSVAALAQLSRVSRRRVQQLLEQLRKSGELHIKHNSGAKTGSGSTNAYWLQGFRKWVGLEPADDFTPVQGVQPTSPDEASFTPQGVQPTSPLNGQGVQPTSPLNGQGVQPTSPNTMCLSNHSSNNNTHTDIPREAESSLRSVRAELNEFENQVLEWVGEHEFWSTRIKNTAALKRNLYRHDSALMSQYVQATSNSNGVIQNDEKPADGEPDVWADFKQQRRSR